MKKLCLSILLSLLVVALAALPVLATYYAYIYIKETAGNTYTNTPFIVSANVSQLVAGQYITSTGLDTRVLTGDGYPLPHMLTNDRILLVTDLHAHEEKQLIFYTGATSLSQFPLILGRGGYVTIPDHANLEPGSTYAFGVRGYVDMTAGADKNIIRKDDALRLYVSAAGQLTFTVHGGNSLTASGVSSGIRTIMVYSDDGDMWIEIDGVERDRDTASAVPDTASTWYLFENDVMPYIYYYGQWVTPDG